MSTNDPDVGHKRPHRSVSQSMNDTSIKFRAPESLKHDLKRLAQSRRISLAALLRLITTEYLREKERL